MLDQPEYERWRAMALDALAAAEDQIERNANHWSCFLAEQAGQFACKGLLHGLGLPAWGHDLVELGTRIGSAGIVLTEPVADALGRLSRHYIATRYPDAHPSGTPGGHYRQSDATHAVDDAHAVLDFVAGRWHELRARADRDGPRGFRP